MCNVKEVIYSDKPTENYHSPLQLYNTFYLIILASGRQLCSYQNHFQQQEAVSFSQNALINPLYIIPA